MKFYRNEKGGNGTMELAPALLVIFVIILIPMLDLMYLGLAYAAGWYCNHLVVREVACSNPNIATGNPRGWKDAEDGATAAWAASGLAKFIGASAGNVTNSSPPTWTPDNATPPNAKGNVTVVTSVKVQPFLPIPFLMQVQGLNAPITFQYSAERPQEEKGIQ